MSSVLPEVKDMRLKILTERTEEELQTVLTNLVNMNPALKTMEKVLYKLAAKQLGVEITVSLGSSIDPDSIQDKDDTTKIADFEKTKLSIVNTNVIIISVGDERLTKNAKPMRYLCVADDTGAADIQIFEPNVEEFVNDGFKPGDSLHIVGLHVKDVDGKSWIRMGNYTQWKYWKPEEDGPLCTIDQVIKRKVANVRDGKYDLICGTATSGLTKTSSYSGCPDKNHSLKSPVGSRVLCNKCNETITTVNIDRYEFALSDETGDLAINIPPWTRISSLPSFDVGDTLLVYGNYQKERKSFSCKAILISTKFSYTITGGSVLDSTVASQIDSNLAADNEKRIDDIKSQSAIAATNLKPGHPIPAKPSPTLTAAARKVTKKGAITRDALWEVYTWLSDSMDGKIPNHAVGDPLPIKDICANVDMFEGDIIQTIDKLLKVGTIFEPQLGKILPGSEDWKDYLAACGFKRILNQKEKNYFNPPEDYVVTEGSGTVMNLPPKKKEFTIDDLDFTGDEEFVEPSDEQIAGCIVHFKSIIGMWGKMPVHQLRNVLGHREGNKYRMRKIVQAGLDDNLFIIKKIDGQILIRKA